MEDGAIYRRNIDKPYDNVGDAVAPDTLYKSYSSNGYSVSADAQFVFYRYNYTKVGRNFLMKSILHSLTLSVWNLDLVLKDLDF